MHNNDPFRIPEETTYDPKTQDAILALAARLQSDAAHGCTLAELEHTAAISGIDPRFVREAARRVEAYGAENAASPAILGMDYRAARRVLILSLLFLPAEFILAQAIMGPGPKGSLVGLGLGMAALLGIAMPTGRRWSSAAAALSVAGTTLAILFIYMARPWDRSFTNSSNSLLFALLQAVIAYTIHALNNRTRTALEERRRRFTA